MRYKKYLKLYESYINWLNYEISWINFVYLRDIFEKEVKVVF